MALEIEKKYLVMKPDTMTLARNYMGVEIQYIDQTYLKAATGERRIRRITTEIPGERDYISTFFYTEKHPADVTGLTRVENEVRIDYREFQNLMAEADPEYQTIQKTRYKFYIGTQKYELDIYDFSAKYAILEIELESETTEFIWPAGIEKVRDVTADSGFKNKALAKTLTLPVKD